MAVQHTVPIIQQDLPPCQTYESICQALLGLQTDSSDVFQQLHARIHAYTNDAHHLAERLHAVESRLEQLGEAGGTPVVVLPARYPAASSPYSNIFREASATQCAADPALDHTGSRASSPDGDASPDAAEPALELASDMLSGASEALKEATSSLQSMAAAMAAASAEGEASTMDIRAARVPGQDTVELLHFFNQPLPMQLQLPNEAPARELPSSGSVPPAALLMFNSSDSPFTSRVEVDLPAMPSCATQAPAFDMQSIMSTLPEDVPRELRSGGGSPALSTASPARPLSRAASVARPLPEISLPKELPDLATAGAASMFSSRRSLATRSERWDRPGTTLPPRSTSRQPPASQFATGSGASAAPTLKRRASASASSLLGIGPQHAAQEPTAASSQQQAHRQPSSPAGGTGGAMPQMPSPEPGAAVKPAAPVPPLRLGSLGADSSPGDKRRTSGAASGVRSSDTWSSASLAEQEPHQTGSLAAPQHTATAAQMPQGRRSSVPAARSPAAAATGPPPVQPASRADSAQPTVQAEASPAAADSTESHGARQESSGGAAPQRSPFEQAAQPAPHTTDTADSAAGIEADAAVPKGPPMEPGRHLTRRSVTMDPAIGRSSSLDIGEDAQQAVSQSAPHHLQGSRSGAQPEQEVPASPQPQFCAGVVPGNDSSQARSSRAAAPVAPAARSPKAQQPAGAIASEARPTVAARNVPGDGTDAPQLVPPLPGQGAFGSGSGSGKSQQALDMQRSISARHLSLGSRPSQDGLPNAEGGAPAQRQHEADAEVLGLRAYLRRHSPATPPWQ